MVIGAQFYTVRSMTQTTEGLADALKKVADIGYRTVQLSATCPYDAEWMKNQLAMNGLRCVLTHTPVPRLTGELDQVIAEHSVFGCDRIGLGWYSFDGEKGDTYEKFMETFSPVAGSSYSRRSTTTPPSMSDLTISSTSSICTRRYSVSSG